MNSVSAGEIGPAAYAAWRSSPLGALTETIEQQVVFELAGELEGRSVLDVGCGDGTLALAAWQKGARVTGIDSDHRMIAAAKERARALGAGASFVEGGGERLPFPDNSFDIVFAVTVLCFVPDAAAFIREMTRVMRPGGRLVIGELGKWSLWAARRRLRGWLGSRLWQAARFRTASELRMLAGQAGLSVREIRGAVFYPPSAMFARLMAPADATLGRLTTFGAAFIVLQAGRQEI